MQFENFDKKIREAADHHHPAYDHNAWNKMEKLLNKHMPEEEENRRGLIIIILLFLLLGGGVFFYLSKNRKTQGSDEQIAKVENQIKPVTGTVNKTESDKEDQQLIQPAENKPVENKSDNLRVNSGDVVKKDVVKITREVSRKKNKAQQLLEDNVQPFQKKQNIDQDKDIVTNKIEKKEPGKEAIKETVKESHPLATAEDKKEELKKAVPDKKDEVVTKTEDQQKKKSKSSKSSFFFLSASAGPDFSIAGLSSPGKVKMVGGVGAGFTYKERFTLRAGFYTARKIYSASPDQYHAPAAFYNYYPNLQKVEADCKVYEIPVTLSYNFAGNKKRNLFVSGGLSSYLMKRETYDFYYKYYPTSPTVDRKRTIYNRNQHYFSIITLSAGYQRNISKSLSVTAEPYLKIPFQGIGFGKVPLNSAGIMFTVGFKPFQRSAKK